MHGGYTGIPAGPDFLQPIKKFQRIEARCATDTGSRVHGAEHGGDKTMNMKQGHDIETSIRPGQSQGGGDIACRRTDILLTQRHQLGSGGSA